MKRIIVCLFLLFSMSSLSFADEMTKGPIFVGTGEPCAIQLGEGFTEAKAIVIHCAERNAMDDGLTQCRATCKTCALLKFSSTVTDMRSERYYTDVVASGSAVFQGYNCH